MDIDRCRPGHEKGGRPKQGDPEGLSLKIDFSPIRIPHSQYLSNRRAGRP